MTHDCVVDSVPLQRVSDYCVVEKYSLLLVGNERILLQVLVDTHFTHPQACLQHLERTVPDIFPRKRSTRLTV